jgi:hypothetical protein
MYKSATALLAAIEDIDDDDQDVFQQSVDPSVCVRDFLGTLSRCPSIFKTMTNFTVDEFEELCQKVCFTIATTARSTGEHIGGAGRPLKLTPPQRLLNLLLYLKHDN